METIFVYVDHLSVKLRLAGILSNNKYIYIATTFYPIAVTLHMAFCHYCWDDCHHSLVYYHSNLYYHLQVSSHSEITIHQFSTIPDAMSIYCGVTIH